MQITTRGWRWLAVLAIVAPTLAWAQGARRPPVQRAEPPKFTRQSANDIFFENAFREGLVGERPADFGPIGGVAASTPAVRPTPGGSAVGPSPAPVPAGDGWAQLISSETLEDEIKAIKLRTDRTITTPSDFAGRGYKAARRDFTVAAMLFAIVAEYNGDVRFKDKAPGVRDVFARTARNAKVGTVQVYNEAKLRKQELDDLLNGSNIDLPAAEAQAKWDQVADRSPLMQYVENLHQGKLQPFTSSEGEFKSNSAEILKVAELVAVVGEALYQDGMPDAGDDEYDNFSKRMRDAAREIVDAVKLNNYNQARTAVGEISKSCSECHELYRS